MIYASVCSGIEAATVAWQQIPGWHPCWFSQYDPEHNYNSGPDFPSRVLQYHYPHIPNLGDMLKLETNETFIKSSFQLLVGGTPCQSFSIAGLRGGLDDVRGNLSLEFCRILAAKQPRWFVWENVPGVHSSFSDETGSEKNTNTGKRSKKNDGGAGGGQRITDPDAIVQSADFARLLEAFQECGYSVCWRILDSQFFGVPQRRRRVFVVGHLGTDWRPPFAVLFERHSLCRDTPQSKKEREATAGKTEAVTGSTGEWWDGGQTSQTIDAVVKKQQTMPEKGRFAALLQKISGDQVAFGGNNTSGEIKKATAVKSNNQHGDFESETFVVGEKIKDNNKSLITQPEAYRWQNKKDGLIKDTVSATVKKQSSSTYERNIPAAIVYNLAQITHPDNGSNPQPGDPSPTLHKDGQSHIVVNEIKQVQWANEGGETENDTIQALRSKAESNYQFVRIEHRSENWALDSLSSSSMKSNNPHSTQQIIRRLTPLECERLQGFPDNYTLIPIKKVSKNQLKKLKPGEIYGLINNELWHLSNDGNRYQAIGNSMTTNVMLWIGQRIDKVDKMLISLGRYTE